MPCYQFITGIDFWGVFLLAPFGRCEISVTIGSSFTFFTFFTIHLPTQQRDIHHLKPQVLKHETIRSVVVPQTRLTAKDKAALRYQVFIAKAQ